MKRITLTILFNIIIFSNLFAQERERTPIGGRPDIKGDLFIELGFNSLNNRPDELQTKFFRSRTFNMYYQYPVNIAGDKSGFTFNPGIGINTDRMAFIDDQTLFNNPEIGPESSELLEITSVYGDDISIRTNSVSASYFEIPLEFRYHFLKNNYRSSMRVALGGKIGYLFQSQTKIAYTDSNGLDRKIKDRQSFGFNPLKYGVYARFGFSGINLWGYYGLNRVFLKEKGPFQTEASQINFGISVALF